MDRKRLLGILECLSYNAGKRLGMDEATRLWSGEVLKDFDAMRQDAQDLRSLLASVHRDGGHHTQEVGVVQSCQDAEKVLAALREELDAKTEIIEDMKQGKCPETHRGERPPVKCRELKRAYEELERHGVNTKALWQDPALTEDERSDP